MFATFKKLFGKKVEIAIDSPTDFQPGAVPPVTRANLPRPVRVDLQPRPAAPVSTAAMPATVSVPLRSVLSRLPETLMQRVRTVDVGEVEIFIPSQKVLSQIAKGAVKISFGELRQMAPPGTFTPENDRDRMLLELPLHEILCRLDPALLARRPVQKHVEVPADVTGPFGGQTKVSFTTSVLKAPSAGQPVPIARAHPAAPVAPVRPAPAVQPPLLPRTQSVPVARQAAPPAQATQPIPVLQPVIARVRPAAPAPPTAPVKPASPELPAFSFTRITPPAPVQPPVQSALPEMPPLAFSPAPPVHYPAPDAFVAPTPIPEEPEIPVLRRTAPLPEPPAQPVYSPIAPEPLAPVSLPESFRNLPATTPISPIASEPEPEPAPIRFNPPFAAELPVSAAPLVPVIPGETRFLTISLMELSQAWPEVFLKEIIQQNLSGSFVGLPFGAVEGAIKQGKIAFPWKAIRSWIKPPIPQTASLHDTAVLELPLKLVTPLFLAELKSSRAQKKVAIDETIPNLFTGSQPLNDAPAVVPASAPVSAPPPPPVPAPVTQKPPDTNYFRKEAEEKPQDAAVFLRKDGTPATEFLKRYATPNEIVGKAASLPGVEGALIALPDGLLVASRIPPTMNAETIAAFLPQIFGRVSQCTRELRLGDLNNLNFTVGNVPWKIYRVGAIYFAVFGRPGEPLPTNQLVGIAAELDRKGK